MKETRQPQPGDIIEVSDDGITWMKSEFVRILDMAGPYRIAVGWKGISNGNWKHWRWPKDEFNPGDNVEVTNASHLNFWVGGYTYLCEFYNKGKTYHIVESRSGDVCIYSEVRKTRSKIVELTMEEIAKKLNIPVDQLRIKD